MDASRRRAYLRLHLASGVGAVTSRRLREAFGDVEAVFTAGPGAWRGVQGVGPKTAEAIAAVTEQDVEDELARAAEKNVRILCLEDDAYPAALKTIYDPPAVLYVRGELTDADATAFAIVGARRCTHYGLEQAERFGQLLGRAGFTVVSGGARGIDAAAHRGALAAGGRTVAVMGCGLSTVYPRDNARLLEGIVTEGRGALVSELPMEVGVQSRNFPLRNRIISGLSLGVLIVEAAARSGSLITARQADEQGRAVFALPGRVDSVMSQGTNELIRDGIPLVATLDHVLDGLGQVGSVIAKAEEQEQAAAVSRPPPGLDAHESKLFDAMGDGPLGLDELVRRTGLPSGQAASALTMLVLKGAVRQEAGNVFARRTQEA